MTDVKRVQRNLEKVARLSGKYRDADAKAKALLADRDAAIQAAADDPNAPATYKQLAGASSLTEDRITQVLRQQRRR